MASVGYLESMAWLPALLLTLAPPTSADCTLVDFEGLGDVVPIGTIAGPVSITFGPSWHSLVDSDAGGSGNFAGEPSGETIAIFTATGDPITFSTPVASVEVAYVARASAIPITLTAYDGSGNVLASTSGHTVGHSSDGAACSGDPTGAYCLWDTLSIHTSVNDIESIVLEGAATIQFAFDDLRVCRTADSAANYCGPAVPNSTGSPASISALGSNVVQNHCFALMARDLPPHQFSLFLNAPSQAFVQHPGGSQGHLCLGGGIGRHVSQIGSASASGSITIDVDLGALPRPAPPFHRAVQPGETWNFQTWYRDGGDSNFTDGVSVTFL